MEQGQEVNSVPNSPDGFPSPTITSEILEAFPDMCFVLNKEGAVTVANTRAASALQRSKESLFNVPFSSLIYPFERNQFRESFKNCCTDGSSHVREAHLLTGTGGKLAAVLFLSRYPVDGLLPNAACLIVARDISEEKKIELDLLRFSNVAHFTVNPLEITDASGKIIYVNPAFERASGYSREDLIGKNPNIFGSGKHPKTFWKKMWETINAGKVWVGEIENLKRGGEPFFTHLLISPIVDGDGKIIGYFGVHRDITEQKQLRQQLIQAQKMESIGLLAAGVAHEVGNPLTSISSLVQVIQRTTQDEFISEKLELIKSQVNRISRIIRDLVDFSRRSNYEVQMTDINKRLREAVEIVHIGKKAKEIAFSVDLDNAAPVLPLVPDQLEQVFINILINAVDAINAKTEAGSSQVANKGHGEIRVRTSVDDDKLLIVISDNGKGISQDALPKIFEPFYTTKRVGEGTGLGLWVSYGIVKSFHGNISVDSVEGQGTTFTISLPLRLELS